MQFKMNLDEESRKSIREMLIGEAKGAARALVQAAFDDEVRKAIATRVKQAGEDGWKIRNMVLDQIRTELSNGWTRSEFLVQVKDQIAQVVRENFGDVIQKLVAEEADRVVAMKLASKTVWEASKQHDYIAEVAKAEIRKMLAGLSK